MLATKAYAAHAAKEALKPYSFERRDPLPHDVAIEILYCGVCHSDIHQVRNEWGGATFPMVPGHEIVGKVTAVGKAVSKYKTGDTVGVGCFVDSCRTCPSCREGLEQYCEVGMNQTYNGKEKDGSPTQGGYSTRIVVDENYVLRIDPSIPLERAAPLLCAGITTYSPLMHWGAGKGKKVAVLGLGGLGHMGVKIGNALGAEVTVLSSSTKKKDDAKKLGATDLFATSDEATFSKLAGHFDLILNTISAPIDYGQYLSLLKRDGSMVLLGVPEKPVSMHAFSFIVKRHSLSGSLIGGIKETQAMLDFCAKHKLAADVEVINADYINQAYERMLKSDVRYRFVMDNASLK